MGNSVSTQSNIPSTQASPPPGCPMHKKEENTQTNPPPGCPMHSTKNEEQQSSTIDPRNMMDTNISQSPAPGQQTVLSSIREISSIPKSAASSDDSPPPPTTTTTTAQRQSGGDGCPVGKDSSVSQGNWEYPSPQQFYNALVRKNKAAPEDSIDMMVHIHNFLNERAWNEVMEWEDRWTEGKEKSQLTSFKGRPQELSPKARYHLFLSRLFPNSYSSEPPFDRHDWTIFRPLSGTSHRYVIDYYSAPEDAEGNTVFSLDVRPALDSPSAIYERISQWARLKKETYFSSSSNNNN